MNHCLRFIALCFFVFVMPFVSIGQGIQQKNHDERIVPTDTFVRAQLKIADSLSVIDGTKADSILTSLLTYQIPNKALWEDVVNLKRQTMAWMSYHNEAIEFLETIINNGNPNPKFYFSLARESMFLFDYSKAISSAREAILIYEANGNIKGEAEVNNLLIEIYGEINMLDEARALFNENLRICNSIDYKEGLVKAYIAFGEALVFDNPSLASEYLMNGMQIAESGAAELSCGVSNFIIRLYINTNQLEKAKREIRKYIENCFLTNYQRDSNVLTLMAHIFSLEKNIDSTIYFNNKALTIRTLASNKKMMASSYLNLAGNYLAKNEIEKANEYLEKAEDLVIEQNNPELLLTYYRGKVKYFESSHDYKNAYLFSQKEIKLSQELTNKRHQSVLSKLNTSFEIQQKNVVLEGELEDRKAATRLSILILTSFIFLIVGSYFIYLYRKKRFSYLKLVNRTSQIERKLSISDKERLKFQSVFDYSVTGILILDKNGSIQYANRKSKNLLGHKDDDLILRIPFADFFEGKNKMRIQETLLNVFIGHEADKGFKVQVINKNNFHWLDVSYAPLVLELVDDTILVTLIDVTQEVINIGMEQKQNKELQTLLNSVTESILFIQRDGKIKALNKTAASRLDSNSEELNGSNYFDFVPKSLKKSRVKMFDKVVQTKKPRIEMEMVGNYNNLVSMYPNINIDGEVDYVSEFVQDITERRMAEEQIDNLKQSVLRSQMNPHFIFNSLTSIQGFIIRNDATMASKYLNSFARLIRLILESSRHDFISLKNEIDILSYYLDIQKMRFSDNFTYSFEIDPVLDLERIKIPPMLSQPFIENSIEHGIQHLEKIGELNVKFVKEGSRVLIELRDNGIGREASQYLNRENIFASKSLSTKIINDRLNALNKYSKEIISYNIIDLKDELNQATGTQVIISIPITTF